MLQENVDLVAGDFNGAAFNTTDGFASELNSFSLIMCIDAPESTTNSSSSGLFEVVRILELVNVWTVHP